MTTTAPTADSALDDWLSWLEHLHPTEIDLGLEELPGQGFHDLLRHHRERGAVSETRFLGLPSFVVTAHEALLECFLDDVDSFVTAHAG